MRRAVTRIGLIIASIALIGTLGVAPSVAVSSAISSPFALYGIDARAGFLQLVQIDPTTAVATGVGTAATGFPNQIGYHAATEPGSNVPYFSLFDGASTWQLYSVDVATGVFTLRGRYEDTLVPGTYPPIRSLAFGLDGTLYGITSVSGLLYTIDPLTAQATPVATVGNFSSLATDPTTGDLWAIDNLTHNLYVADALTPLAYALYGNITFPMPTSNYGMQIDEDGQFWLATADSFNGKLYTFAAAPSIAPTQVGIFAGPRHVLALAIVDLTPPAPPAPPVTPAGPQLANSGADYGAATGIALGAGILALLGVTLVLVRRRSAAG